MRLRVGLRTRHELVEHNNITQPARQAFSQHTTDVRGFGAQCITQLYTITQGQNERVITHNPRASNGQYDEVIERKPERKRWRQLVTVSQKHLAIIWPSVAIT